MSPVVVDAVVQELAGRLRGELLRPRDEGYDRTRMVWNGMVDRRPALIVRCAGVGDVMASVAFGRQHGLPVSVRGGGHNIAGKAVCDDGLMLDLSGMNSIDVDPARRSARVGGGALVGALDHETQVFGLATTSGIVPSTGVAGLTLGGGGGRLARKHGLACDNLLAVDLVTATGQFLRASPGEHADLFWGVRGGGGNFGVVTALELRLHPIGPVVLGGILVYSWDRARDAIAFYDEFARTAPGELSADPILMTSPDGDRVVAISVCYIGSIQDGERVLRPLREFGPPVADLVGPVGYVQLQASGEAAFPKGLHYFWKSHLLTEISRETIDAVLAHFEAAPSPRSIVAIQQYGGAVGRVGPTDTAFWPRDAQFDFIPGSIWTDPEEADGHIDWVRQLWDVVKPAARGVYVNDLGEEGEDRVRLAYGDNYGRLTALKSKYDPTNFFRLNANIPPMA
jgi:FAD/FMN-containing dehydrogenase